MRTPKLYLIALACAFVMRTCHADESQQFRVDFVVQSKSALGSGQEIYLSGDVPSLGPWKPDGLKLLRSATGDQWRGHLMIKSGDTLAFKFTCGTWKTVEKGPVGQDVSNRKVHVDSPKKISVTVDSWGDEHPDRALTVTGDLHRLPLTEDNSSPTRSVHIWLPPGYEQASHRYPVLYLLDGQNIFDAKRASFGVEWQADESASKLIEQSLLGPFLIVAIDNSPRRTMDYTRNKEDQSLIHLDWIVDVVKHYVDTHFRTIATPTATAIGGSSLGGLFALDAFISRSDVFGSAICMSPSLFWDDECLLQQVIDGDFQSGENDRRLWIDFGTHESNEPARSAAHVERFNRLQSALESHSVSKGLRVLSRLEKDGEHNEAAWAKRLPSALQFIFGN